VILLIGKMSEIRRIVRTIAIFASWFQGQWMVFQSRAHRFIIGIAPLNI
jgi:hypothetical protein